MASTEQPPDTWAAGLQRVKWHLDREPSKSHILMLYWSTQIALHAIHLFVVNPKKIPALSFNW